MSSVHNRIQELGLKLPDAPNPVANYVPAIILGNEIRTSGQIPLKEGQLLFKGAVPSCQSIEDAKKAAEV